jgi:hypothetical protein
MLREAVSSVGLQSGEGFMKRLPQAILADLDLLRDRRHDKTITEDDCHAEWDRLWAELREADRLAKGQAEEGRQSAASRKGEKEQERRPNVYCDGACEPGQPLGIGVFSADCGIEISLQLDESLFQKPYAACFG